MDKFAGIRPTIPEWYADEIERLEIPRNGTIGEVVLDFILALKDIVKNIKFRKSLRFLQDVSRTKLQTLFSSIYVYTKKPLNLEQYDKLNHAGRRLKQLAVEYIYTNNSFYNEETRNPSELIGLIQQVGKAFEGLLNELEMQKELMIQNVNEEEVVPKINQAFRFVNTLKSNIRNDIESAIKNTQIWSEIYSGPIGRWNEKIDRYKEENTRKKKFKPEKFDDEPINSTIDNLKDLVNSQSLDEQPWNRGKDSSRFFTSFTSRLSDLNKFFVQTFRKSNFSSTASSIAKLINDTGLRRYDKTKDLDDLVLLARKIDDLRKTGGLAETINRLDQAWKYFQVAIKSGKFPSDESTSVEMQRSFEEIMKQVRQLQELISDANLGSYYRKISLAFIEDLTSFA